MLQQIVRDLLAGDRDIQIEQDVAPSLSSVEAKVSSSPAVVVIEADPPGFAQACEILPNIRLVGITRDWRQASVRFNTLSRERLRDAIRCVAGGHVT